MRFSIVTPCYNAERHIGETIDSILQQTALKSGRATLQYFVVDGKSQDRTLEIIRERIANFPYGDVEIISEPDNGMYDALTKGFRQVNGDVCAYLNAGDLYNPHAFDVIIDVLTNHPKIQWLTGMQICFNEAGEIIYSELPFRYRTRLFLSGMYDGRHFRYLQQESTFWRCDLLQFVDFSRLVQFKYAGDFYLWHCFAQHTELKIVKTHLGGFRFHRGQLSENERIYDDEIRAIARTPTPVDRLTVFTDKMLNIAPGRIWKWLNRNAIVIYNRELERWG